MLEYIPPFHISNLMISKIASISEKVGKIDTCSGFEKKLHLRRNNRIKSVHSSLKIEANSLSLDEVRDVLNGKNVLGDQRDIKEVKNAYEAYEKIVQIDPYKISDLLAVHKIMTADLISESGKFRTGNEGVFNGTECIFVAPPPHMVPDLIKQLFDWMKKNSKQIHPLILSAIFHYEFVFIHPFSDGNGRIARLWHTILLSKWKNFFEFIPIESQIEKYQTEYYQVISLCHKNGNFDCFIDFILDCIEQVLDEIFMQITNCSTSKYVQKMLSSLEYGVPYTASEIMEKIGLKSKETFRKNYVNPAIKLGAIVMEFPDTPTSKNQRYIKK